MAADPEEQGRLRNRVKVRLLLAGVDREVVETLAPDAEVVDLFRAATVFADDPPITLAELAERTGLPVELCRRARMLVGLPDPGDEPRCRTSEIDTFRSFAAGMEMFGVEPVLQFTRVIGAAAAMVAEGALSVFGRALEDSDSELTGDAYALAAFDALDSFDLIPPIVAAVTRLHFDLAADRLTANPGQAQVVAVGFVDLVRSTRTTETVGAETMSAALSRFEERAVELAVRHGGRVVKFIGDEAMFVCPDLAAGVEVARGLVDHVAADEVLGGARGAVAYGEAMGRDGDWFGTTVNVAARMLEKTRPGTVNLTGEGAESIPGAVERRGRRLRDIDERVRVWRIEP